MRRAWPNGAPCPPLRLNASEAQGVGHGGVLRITAIGAAQLVCLNPPGWMAVWGICCGWLALLTASRRVKTGAESMRCTTFQNDV